MNSFELNKIAMGVLMALLFVIGLNNLSEVVFHEDPMEANAYPIDVAAVASADVADVAMEEGPSIAELLQTADIEKGMSVFKKCAACHTPDNGGANKIGPNLWGIVGRELGSKADFNYSDAMATHGGEWNYELLDRYLTRPKDEIPGNKMVFAGLKRGSERADVILYLRSLSDAPIDLPVAAAEEAVETVEEEAAPETM